MRHLRRLLVLVLAAGAGAHTPHDVVVAARLSPAFAQDDLVLATFQLTDHTLFGRSEDRGRSWTLYGGPQLDGKVRAIAFSPDFANDGTVFVGTALAGVARSTDRGLTFEPVTTGLTELDVHSLAVSADFATDQTVIAGTPTGLFRSTDAGDTWTLVTAGLVESAVRIVAADPAGADGTLFAAGQVVHRSDDGGLSWTPLFDTGMRVVHIAVSPDVAQDETLAVSFGRYGDGVLVSEDDGLGWAPMVDGLLDATINVVEIADDGTFFAISRGVACYRAPGALQRWSVFDDGLESLSDQTEDHYVALAVSPDFGVDQTVFVGAFEGLFRSVDAGETWLQRDVYSQLINRHVALSPGFAQDRQVFLGNYGGGVYLARDRAVIPTSADGSVLLGGPAPTPPPGTGGAASGGSGAAPAGAGDRVGGSRPSHTPWAARSVNIGTLFTDSLAISPDFVADGTMFYSHVGMWRTHDRGVTWEKLPTPVGNAIIRAIGFSPDFATDQTVFFGTTALGTYKSTDGGDSWTLAAAGLPALSRTSTILPSPAYAVDDAVFLSTKNFGMFRSTDGGANWTEINTGITELNVREFTASPEFATDATLFCGTVGDGLFRSVDGGDTWQPLTNGLPSVGPQVVESVVTSPAYGVDRTVFVALRDDGVHRSRDAGESWEKVGDGLGLSATRVLAISPAFPDDRTLYLGTFDWVWRSTDGGESFTRLDGFTRVDDGHPTLFYDGAWTTELEPGSNGITITGSSSAGASFDHEFYGDAVSWYATRGPAGGLARVFVDGQQLAVVDLYAPTVAYGEEVFATAFEAPDWHVIRVSVLGSGSPGSTGAEVRSDGLAIQF